MRNSFLSTVKNVILWDFHTQVELYSLNLSLGTQETFPSCPEFFDPPNPLFFIQGGDLGAPPSVGPLEAQIAPRWF